MTRNHRIAAGLGGAVLILLLIVLVLQPGWLGPSAPPLTGWMEKFTPAARPRPAPQSEFAARDGAKLTLANFRGRLVLVNFWATWCGPCLRELPSLVRLHARLGGDDFTVLALSEDRRGWPVMQPYVEKLGLGALPVYHDTGSRAALDLGISGLPATILYDRAGKELGRLIGPAEWDSDEAVALMRYYMAR